MQAVDHLVVLGSTLTGLALVRAAHAAGLQVTLVDANAGIATFSRYPEVVRLSTTEPSKVLAELERLAAARPSALVADSDAWLRFIVQHDQRLRSIFAQVLHPGADAARICLDKNDFLRWCEGAGFAAPRRYEVTADMAVLPEPVFPLLIRPESTRHGMGNDLPKAIEVQDREALAHWLTRYRALGAQPAVSQSLLRPRIRQYSIGIARRRSGATRTMVAEKLRSYPDQCAGGTFVVLTRQDRVASMALRMLEALDYVGIAEVEIMHDDSTGESFVIEINARPWTQFALSQSAGLDFLGFLLRDGGAADRPGPEETNRAKRWLNFEADAFACFSRSTGVVRHGRLGLLAYLKSVSSANVFAVWDADDRRPFRIMLSALVRHLVARS